jgi:DNA-binding NtrC family response regulator
MYLHLATSHPNLRDMFVASRLCNDISHKPIDAALVVKVASGIVLDPKTDRYPTLADVEREHIARALRDHKGNIVHAAEALGLYPNSLRRKMERHGLRARTRTRARASK